MSRISARWAVFSKDATYRSDIYHREFALAGVPPLSGFWSKDEILLTAFASGHSLVFWTLLLTAFMTAFYMFRLVFMTFLERRETRKFTLTISGLDDPASGRSPGAILLGIRALP